jgi:hypothetical protein
LRCHLARDGIDQIERSGELGSRLVVGLNGFIVGTRGVKKLDETGLAAAIRIFRNLSDVSSFVEHRALDPVHSVSGNFVLGISRIHVGIDTGFEGAVTRCELLLFPTRAFDFALVLIEDR